MQRPPDRKSPEILFSRGTSEWVSRVNQRHKALTELRLSDENKHRLDRWMESEFVYATLKLEGASIDLERVKKIVSHSPDSYDNTEDELIKALLDAIRRITSLARRVGKAVELTPEVLLEVRFGAGSGFRQTSDDLNTGTPTPAEHLPALIENACRWYTAESFTELNPVEQASIVLLRLIELQPFDTANERTALVAASLFTIRSELPPIIIGPNITTQYRRAVDEGIKMNTKPMVEALAAAIEISLERMIEEIQRRRKD